MLTPDQLADKIRAIIEKSVDDIENSPGMDPGAKLDMLSKAALVLQRIRAPSTPTDPATGKALTDKQLIERSGGLNDE